MIHDFQSAKGAFFDAVMSALQRPGNCIIDIVEEGLENESVQCIRTSLSLDSDQDGRVGGASLEDDQAVLSGELITQSVTLDVNFETLDEQRRLVRDELATGRNTQERDDLPDLDERDLEVGERDEALDTSIVVKPGVIEHLKRIFEDAHDVFSLESDAAVVHEETREEELAKVVSGSGLIDDDFTLEGGTWSKDQDGVVTQVERSVYMSLRELD